MGHCRWLEALLAIIIIVFTWWPSQILLASYSMWVVIVSAALLLVHALFCRKCEGLCMGMMKSGRGRSRRRR